MRVVVAGPQLGPHLLGRQNATVASFEPMQHREALLEHLRNSGVIEEESHEVADIFTSCSILADVIERLGPPDVVHSWDELRPELQAELQAHFAQFVRQYSWQKRWRSVRIYVHEFPNGTYAFGTASSKSS